MRRWLSTLAEELRVAGSRDWLWWQLARHTFPTPHTARTAKLVFGLTSGLTAAPEHADLRLRGRVPELLRGLVIGLVIGLAGGLALGLVVGLIYFGASPSVAQRASSPAESQRGDRRLNILIISTSGLAFGLAGGLMDGLAFGLMGGLMMPGLMDRAWPAFLIAAGWLGARRRLPWRLMAFLDDAYRLGLLRVVGPAYQFRHAELQDHLAP